MSRCDDRSGFRILVVEDDCFLAEATRDVLTGVGYEVVGLAATADDAVRLAHELRPDLVLTDIDLGGERDGIDAARVIAERLRVRSLFLSGSINLASRVRASVVPNAGFLSKPVRSQTLIAAIEAARARQLEGETDATFR